MKYPLMSDNITREDLDYFDEHNAIGRLFCTYIFS